MTTPDTPTARWLATAGLQPLEGPAGTAERLFLLIHYGIDWSAGWISTHRRRYWDEVFPDRLEVATYTAPTLRRWWSEVTTEVGSSPRSGEERAETNQLLGADPDPVLEVIRYETRAILLQTRMTAEAVRDTRAEENR